MKTVALGEVADIDRTSISADKIKPGTTYVGLEHVDSGGQIVATEQVSAGDLKSNKFVFTEEHVLFGKLRPNLGKVADPQFAGICSTDILPVLPGPALDRRYLYHFLRLPAVRSEATRLAVGINLPRLKPQALAEMFVPLPPIEEQRRIASLLDAADNIRAKRRQALAKLDTLTHAVFVDIFGDPRANPCGSNVVELGDLLRESPQNGVYKKASEYGAGTRIMRIESFGGGTVEDVGSLKRVNLSSTEIARYGLEKDEIILNRVNSRSHLGKSAIIPQLDEPVAFESNMMRLRVDDSVARPRFVIEFLQSAFVKRQILTVCKDSINQSSINQGDVVRLQVPLPPIDRQDAFARCATEIRTLQQLIGFELASHDTLFASLQQRAFRGEL